MDDKRCEICGTKLEDDLFSYVTREPVCSICRLKYIGGLTPSIQGIKEIRSRLGLKDGEYIEQLNAVEAKRILGR